MKYIFIALCLLLSLINWIHPIMGYTATSGLYTHFTYIFAHANIFHLAINLFVFWKLYDMVGKYSFMVSFLIAAVMSFFAIMSVPTVGASGLTFAMLGMFYLIQPLKWEYYLYNLIIIVIALFIGYYAFFCLCICTI